jgi:hypothetical protein
VEPQHPQSSPSGWHHDPSGRFEYRYFNGVQWTSDVAVNGQRYVDSPIEQVMPQLEVARRPRGMAIASFVTAISAVAIGWIPFIFVLAAAAAIAAVVFGILGLKRARQHDGYGRGFAITGLALSPVALAVCVGGFFFTRAVLREFRDFFGPGPHELFVDQPCTLSDGRATLHGTIRNLDDVTHDYRIAVDFTGDDDSDSATARVNAVAPNASEPWSSSVEIAGDSVECKVTDVFGPFPFEVDNQS